MELIFGIDGGGTNSRLRIESVAGEPVFAAEGGSTNPNSRSRAEIEACLAGLFGRAAREAGLAIADFVAGYVGSAGIDRDGDRAPFEGLLRGATGLACPIGIGNDTEPALAGAHEDTEGLLLISGTGAIAYGRTRQGRSARAGGWGHLLGDEGSAFRIAFDGICRGIRSSEGRDLPTGLLAAALDHFGLPEPTALIPFIYGGFDKTRIGRFARRVGALRDSGDALAIDIFRKAAEDLEGLVESVYRRVAAGLERPRVAFRGGLIESDAPLRASLGALIGSRMPGLQIVEAKADAARGACLLARELARGS